MNKTSSPSRRYVAMCCRTNFKGYYFKRFTLPKENTEGVEYMNDTQTASWYFLNKLNLSACIDGCLTEEDYKDVTEQGTGLTQVFP